MDARIYRPTLAEMGIYATRRYPKGVNSGAVASPDVPVNVSKPNYSDASVKAGLVAAGQGAGLATVNVMASYTVPKGRRAEIQNAYVSMTRKFAAGPASFSSVQIRVTRANGGKSLAIVMAYRTLAALGDWETSVSSTGPIDLFEGDTCDAWWSDDSTGGNVEFVANAIIVEFDSLVNYIPSGSNDPRFQTFDPPVTRASVFAAPANTSGGGGSAPFVPPFAAYYAPGTSAPTSGLLA